MGYDPMPQECEITGMPFIMQDGHVRYLASLPPQRQYAFKKFSSRFATIPRNQWYEKDLSSFCPYVWDQDSRGACVGHGSVAGISIALALAGQTVPQLCPWFTYSDIDGGQDSGAVVQDALESLTNKGTCLFGSVPYGTYQQRQVPQAAFEEAKRFRIDEALKLDSFDEGVSAILNDRPWVFGIDIGNAFNPDPQTGIVPDLRGGGGGHCMCGVGLKMIGGKPYVKVLNSWGKQFGVGGYCYMPESYFDGQGGHFAIICGLEDPMDPTKPPVINS